MRHIKKDRLLIVRIYECTLIMRFGSLWASSCKLYTKALPTPFHSLKLHPLASVHHPLENATSGVPFSQIVYRIFSAQPNIVGMKASGKAAE